MKLHDFAYHGERAVPTIVEVEAMIYVRLLAESNRHLEALHDIRTPTCTQETVCDSQPAPSQSLPLPERSSAPAP